MPLVLTINTTAVPIGPGSLTTPTIPAARVRYVLTVQQQSWPLTGGKAFDMKLEWSPDGVAWFLLTSSDVFDVAIPAIKIYPAGQMRWVCQIPAVGTTGRRLRLSWDFAKALSISGTVFANN